MNKIYKVQYNDALGTWVAVPEIAKGRSKSTSSVDRAESATSLSRPNKWALTTLAAALLPMVSGQAFAKDDLVIAADGFTRGGASGAACYRTNPANGARMLCGTGTVDANADYAFAAGYDVYVSQPSAIAIGKSSQVNNKNGSAGIAIGTSSSSKGGISLGNNSKSGENGVVIGKGSETTNDNVILGNNIKGNDENVTNSIFLGNNSTYIELKNTAKLEEGKLKDGTKDIDYIDNTGKEIHSLGASTSSYNNVFNNETTYAGENKGVLSVGTKDNTRRLQGISAGALTAGSTDAINGSQLYYTNKQVSENKDAIDKNKDDIAKNKDDIGKNKNDIAKNTTNITNNTNNIAKNKDNIADNKDNIAKNKAEIDKGWNAGVIEAGGKAKGESINIKLGDTLNYAAGSNIELTPDAANKTITVATKDDVEFKNVTIGDTITIGDKGTIENTDPNDNKSIANVEYVKGKVTKVKSGDDSITVIDDNIDPATEQVKDPTKGHDYNIKVNKQAIVDGAKIPVVYTVTKDDQEVKVTFKDDGLYYLNNDGTSGEKVPDELAKDLAKNVHASMNNADGDVNTPMALGNLGKGTRNNDAGNVAQLNDILGKLGNPDDPNASLPKIGANGSVEGLEYYLTSGNPNEDWHKALGEVKADYDAEYDKEYTARYDALKVANDAKPQDQQQTDDALKAQASADAREAAEALVINKRQQNYSKVTSVGGALDRLNTAVNQAITVKADKGAKDSDPNSQGVYLGGEFSIVGGNTEVKTWDDATNDYAKDSSGKYVTTDVKNITTSIEDGKVVVSMTDTPQFTTADIQHVDPSKGTSAINVDFLKKSLKDSATIVDSSDGTIIVKNNKGSDEIANKYDIRVNSQKVVENAQLPVVYTDKEGNKVYLTTDPATNAPKFSKNPDGTEPVDTANVVATMQTPNGTTEIAKGTTGTGKTEIIPEDANKPNGARDINLASPVSDDPITISVDDDGNYKRVKLSPDAQAKTTSLNNIASVGDYTKVENAAKAVNGADLNNAIAGVLSYVDQTKVTSDGGWTLSDGSNDAPVANGKKVTLQGDDDKNIRVIVSKDSDNANAKIELNKDLKNINSVVFGDADDNGNATSSSTVSITKNGIKAGEKKITNVADGAVNASSHDAVNGSQLYRLKQDIDNIDNRASAGTAAAMATAGLTQIYLPGKSMVSAAASHYRGQSAIAVGLSTISDNGKWIIKGAANANKEDLGVTVGVGYMW